MLLCLSNLGSFMASSFQFAFGKIYCCFWCSSRRCCCRRNRRNRRGLLAVPPLVHQPGLVLSTKTEEQFQPAVCSKPTVDARPSSPVARKSVQLTVGDLAELMERDYDIVQEESAVKTGNKIANSEHYAMDRLNQDARSVLAVCSSYYHGDSNKQPIVVSLSNDWDKTDIDLSDGTADEKNHGVVTKAADGGQQHQHQSAGQRVPVSVVMAFLVGYICLGAAVFSAWEEWSYLDGAYFSFITLSTIGFGDLVPGSKVLEQGQTKLVACIVYLVVGLAMIAMSFNLVQEEVITQFQRLGQNMGILDEK